MSIFTKILRAGEGKKVRALQSLVPDINALEPEIEGLSDEELARRTLAFRERLGNGEALNDLLVESFAVVDILRERTTILVEGHAEEAAETFGAALVEGSAVQLEGILSRKKHIVPQLGLVDKKIEGR